MNGADGMSPREIVGALLLTSVPVGLLFGPLHVAGVVVGWPSWVAPLVALVAGGGAGLLAGPVLARRTVTRLPSVEDERLTGQVDTVAAERGIAAENRPGVLVVESNAATVAVIDGWGSPTLVVPTRLRELAPDSRDAAIAHALCRIEGWNAAFVTMTLAPALLVELWTLVAIELLRRREASASRTDRPRMLGEPEDRRGVPRVAYPIVGALLLLLVAPFWLAFALGDRLLVSGGRRRADALIAERGDGDALVAALTFARDATGAADWPPTLDRLSLVPLADTATRRVRGTSRNETRIRLARLHAKR